MVHNDVHRWFVDIGSYSVLYLGCLLFPAVPYAFHVRVSGTFAGIRAFFMRVRQSKLQTPRCNTFTQSKFDHQPDFATETYHKLEPVLQHKCPNYLIYNFVRLELFPAS